MGKPEPEPGPDPKYPSWVDPDEPLVDWATFEKATDALVAKRK